MENPGREKRKEEKEGASPGRRSGVGKVIEATEVARRVDSTTDVAGRQGVEVSEDSRHSTFKCEMMRNFMSFLQTLGNNGGFEVGQ